MMRKRFPSRRGSRCWRCNRNAASPFKHSAPIAARCVQETNNARGRCRQSGQRAARRGARNGTLATLSRARSRDDEEIPRLGSGGGVPSGAAGAVSSGGAGNTDAGASPDVAVDGARAWGGCSDPTPRTGPPAGKEFLKADPIDTPFPFSTHWMGRFSDNPSAVGITGMADYDHDGDLDFSSGQRGGPMFWWEYCTPDHWVQHMVGSGHQSPGGGNAVDVDGDAKPDVLGVWNAYNPQWRKPGPDPTVAWPLGAFLMNVQTQGGAIADLDGDKDNGDLDVFAGESEGTAWIWENTDGKGTFKEHAVAMNARGHDARVGDVDSPSRATHLPAEHDRRAWRQGRLPAPERRDLARRANGRALPVARTRALWG
jgi:hypothetical protein